MLGSVWTTEFLNKEAIFIESSVHNSVFRGNVPYEDNACASSEVHSKEAFVSRYHLAILNKGHAGAWQRKDNQVPEQRGDFYRIVGTHLGVSR